MPSPESATKPLIGEVIAIGDELTTGQRLDTNTQWLSQRLTEQGIDVRFHTTVADQMTANVAVFRAAAERARVVVSTGGLGPTADDLTRDAMAEAAGVPLVDDPELATHIEAIFTSRGRKMPSQNLRQAQLPEGAIAINNPGGTAPGVDQTVGGCRFFALPGVPAEMREMWAETVAPAIESMAGPRRVMRHWLVRCFGAGESHIESLLPDLIARGREPLVGITASHGTITLRVTASGEDETAALRAMRPALEEIRRTLGDLVFGEHAASLDGSGPQRDHELQHEVLLQLEDRELTVATVESMTRGLLTSWMAAGESELEEDFTGGFLNGSSLLKSSRYLAPDSPVDVEAEVAKEANADCAIVVGSQAGQTVRVAVRSPAGTAAKEITLVGHPSIHRPLVAKHALNLLRLELLGDSSPD